jgi:hypothetical protein
MGANRLETIVVDPSGYVSRFQGSNVLFIIWNWSRSASKVLKGMELEPFWPRGEPKSDLPDV